jgi:hypothetical protein
MVTSQLPPVMMIMVCMKCALGGAEKQYARVFEMLARIPDINWLLTAHY